MERISDVAARWISGWNAITRALRFQRKKPYDVHQFSAIPKNRQAKSATARPPQLMSIKESVVQQDNVDSPVLRLALFGVIGRNREILAHADGGDALGVHAQGNQGFEH